jgi:hypothetical protein
MPVSATARIRCFVALGGVMQGILALGQTVGRSIIDQVTDESLGRNAFIVVVNRCAVFSN